MKKELAEEEYKKLGRAMWLLRENAKDLVKGESEVLKLVFKYFLILKITYKLHKDLTNIFDSDISKSET